MLQVRGSCVIVVSKNRGALCFGSRPRCGVSNCFLEALLSASVNVTLPVALSGCVWRCCVLSEAVLAARGSASLSWNTAGSCVRLVKHGHAAKARSFSMSGFPF